ncbi:MAG: hypothetical protein C0506_13405 [Anaerolinea sp.]|nr:hypothetical protein [Anaerolinea sp.]
MSNAGPAYGPYLRFARNVLLVDLAMGVVVLVVSVWRGWTSVEESTVAILAGGGALIGLAMLPGIATANSSAFGHGAGGLLNQGTNRYYAAVQLDDPDAYEPSPGITWTLLAAGFIPVVYAAIVAMVVL